MERLGFKLRYLGIGYQTIIVYTLWFGEWNFWLIVVFFILQRLVKMGIERK